MAVYLREHMAGTVNGRYRYAFALPSFLLVISLLMILLGAFVATQRSNFALLKSSADSDKSLATCHAVYEYVRYRLEHDKTWGKTPFQGLTDDRLGSGLTVVEKPGTRHLRGTLAGLDTTFEAELYYNLDSESEHSGLPPESARLIVDAHSLTRSAHSEALFHVAPLFDSSVLSRGKVGIDASSLSVRSRDPYRNNIRAEGAIDVPEVLGNDPRTLFLKPDSNTTDPRGIIWSRDHISSAGVDLNGHIQEANANSGGTFLPEANQQFQIFDLQPDQLVSPPNVVEIGAGEYRFTMVNAVVTGMATVTGGPPGEDGVVPTRSLSFTVNQDIEVLEYYKNPNSTRPTEVYRSATRTDDIDEDSIKMQVQSSFPPQPDGSPTPITISQVQAQNIDIQYPDDSWESLVAAIGDVVQLDAEGKVKADLLNQKISIAADTTVETRGDLFVTSKRGSPPYLELSRGSTDPSHRAALIADGGINIETGITTGMGTLIAKGGDVSIRPKTNTVDVNTSSSSGNEGLVVYAQRDVLLSNPNKGGSWTFRGLVYAHDSFDFDAQGARVTIDGTLVSKEGNISVRGADAVDFVYNPAYLKKMVRGLPLDRIQLERVSWKE